MRAISSKVFAAGLVCCFLLPAARVLAGTVWTATAFGEPKFTPRGINDAGTVVGYVGDSPSQQAVVWRHGTQTMLATPSSVVSSVAESINDRGQIAGTVTFADGSQEAVMWERRGRMTELGFLPGGNVSSANDINDRGQVVGSAGPGDQAVIWDNGPGTIKSLQTPPNLPSAAYGSANAINDRGQIVGTVGDPVVWQNEDSAPTFLPPLAEGFSGGSATDINNRGQIVGTAPTVSPYLPQEYHAVLWQSGTVTDLEAGGTTAGADAINARGQIVGTWSDESFVPHAFVVQRSGSAVLPPLSGTNGSSATGINNSGHVIGESGIYPGGQGLPSDFQAVMWSH
jgi:probable HAF family extracellular repeat protein